MKKTAFLNIALILSFVARVCNWEDSNECPAPERRWKSTADAAAVKISERLTRILDAWQRENGVLRAIDREIIGVFRKELGLMDNQIQELEGMS